MDAGQAPESIHAGTVFPASIAVTIAAGYVAIHPKVSATGGRQVAVY
jgi:hypothetical protein